MLGEGVSGSRFPGCVGEGVTSSRFPECVGGGGNWF